MGFLLSLSTKLAASMLQLVIQQLASPAMTEVGHIWKVEEKLKKLLATYEKIQALFDKCEGFRQFHNTTALETRLQKLEGYCYDTEDLVDYLGVVCKIKNRSIRRQIIESFSIKGLKTPRLIVKLRKKLERVSGEIEAILNAMNSSNSLQVPLQELSAVNHRNPLSDKTELVSVMSRNQVMETIIMKLTSSNKDDGVSIVGMDGLGKTALARTILADLRIKDHFPLILSAHVSNYFQADAIFQNLSATSSQTIDAHQRVINLQALLSSNRALIVLDDLWKVKVTEWDYFKCNYLKSSPGWKILTTTRNPNVAEVTKSFAYYLDTLTDDECTELIMQRANLCKSDRETWKDDLNLIAKKCKGVPVVAHMFGLIMSTKVCVDELRDTIVKFKNKDLWELPDFREVFLSLNLNEPKLQPDLKRCFTYCSLFSPTHKYSKDELIQLWEGEGFVRRRDPYSTGNECFDKLLSRSILKPPTSTSDKPPMYEMHGFNHEFAQHLTFEAFCRIDEGKINFPSSYTKNLRHLSLNCENTNVQLLKKIEKCKRLRTFLLLHPNKPKKRVISYPFFHKLKCLRLLDLRHTTVGKLLEPIGPLKLLKYLDLSNTDIQKLHDSICNLRALQVLKLVDCFNLEQLPDDLNQLINLTHLYVNMNSLASLPSKLGMLINLEILSSYIVGSNEGNKVTELENMDHLTEICIFGVENIIDWEEAQESMLSIKKQLERLILAQHDPNAEIENASDTLEGLKPHNDLKELTLRNYRFRQFPTWLSSSSQKLTTISLENCPDCEVLPSLGQLPLLKTLLLRSLGSVKIVDGKFNGQAVPGFRHLELLEFHELGSLLSWTGLRTGDMPCLQTLKIIGCPLLTCLPSLIHQGCLVYMEINNCIALESLPEIPPSMKGECGKLIICGSPSVEERCKVGGADWPKIKDMACYKDKVQTITAATLSPQTRKVLLLYKSCVSMLNGRNKGSHFSQPYWVILLVLILIPIMAAVMY